MIRLETERFYKEDGRFGRIRVKWINDHILLMSDNDEATGYLVLGAEKAVVIDTMNGYENVKQVAEHFTDLPLMVVNTHGHPDHVYGNIYFDKAYMNPADEHVVAKYCADPRFVEATTQMGLRMPPFEAIGEGDVIDLGGLKLEVYDLPGHTPGGIALLDRQDRILFVGDSIIEQTWMQLEESLSMEAFLKGLDRIQELRSAFDYILTGHGRHLEDASLCEEHRQAVWELCQGRKENDEPYSWFGGVCRAHPYGKELRRIVYDDNLIHTPRMLLRMLGDEEMQKIIDEEKDPEMVQAYQEMYTGCLEHPQQRQWYVIWGMELPDGTRVGDFCFKGLGSDGMVEIGYGVAPEYQGNGYATEMTKAAAAWARRQPGVTRVEAETDPQNFASQRVLEKAGFVPNGVMGEEGPRFVYRG